MTSSWPTSIDDFGHVTGTEATSQPNDAGLTHSMIHNLLADAVTKLETNLQGFQPPSSGATETILYELDAANYSFYTSAWENPSVIASGSFTLKTVDTNNKFIMRINTHLNVLGGGGALLKFTINGNDYVIGTYGAEWRGDIAGAIAVLGTPNETISWSLSVVALLNTRGPVFQLPGIGARTLVTNQYSHFVYFVYNGHLYWMTPGSRPGFTIPGIAVDPNGNPVVNHPAIVTNPITVGVGPYRTAMSFFGLFINNPSSQNAIASLVGVLNFGDGTVSIAAESVSQAGYGSGIWSVGTTGAIFTPDTSSATPNGALAFLPDVNASDPQVLCVGVGTQIRLISINNLGTITPGSPVTVTSGAPIIDLAISGPFGGIYEGWAATSTGLYPFTIASNESTVTIDTFIPIVGGVTCMGPASNAYSANGLGGNVPAVIGSGNEVLIVSHPSEGPSVTTTLCTLSGSIQGSTVASIVQILPGNGVGTWVVVSLASNPFAFAIQTIGNGGFYSEPDGVLMTNLGIGSAYSGVVSVTTTNDVICSSSFGQLGVFYGSWISNIGELKWGTIEPGSIFGLNAQTNVFEEELEESASNAGMFVGDYGWHGILITTENA